MGCYITGIVGGLIAATVDIQGFSILMTAGDTTYRGFESLRLRQTSGNSRKR